MGNHTIIILFLLKVLAGLANGWINLYHYQGTDSAMFHREGIIEYHLLLNDPKNYLFNIFNHNSTTSYAAIFDTSNSFWNNLRSNIIIKMLSIFDIFSRCNYFINTLFYNFLVFFGCVWLYRIFIQIFPERKNTLIATVFLLPSVLYFTSGIHREGLLSLSLAFVCYNMFYILRKEPVSFKRILYIFLGLSFIFLLRNFVFITLIPALMAWVIAEKKQKSILLTFTTVYIFFTLIFFSLKFIHPKLDLPQYVSERQTAFIQIGKLGASTVPIKPLYPDVGSFLKNAPQALNHSLMRPYLFENLTLLYIPPAIEIVLYEILLVTFLFFRVKNSHADAFVYFGLFFSLSMFLIIGYTIPILGAIVRYRSIYQPFIICPLACLIDLKEIQISFKLK